MFPRPSVSRVRVRVRVRGGVRDGVRVGVRVRGVRVRVGVWLALKLRLG